MTARRNKKAALRFFKKAIGKNQAPRVINIDKSGANTAGIKLYNKENNTNIEIRQCKYLNNMVEQDHQRVKKITKATLGFKNFYSAKRTLAGIELVAMLRKNQMDFCAKNSMEAFWILARM